MHQIWPKLSYCTVCQTWVDNFLKVKKFFVRIKWRLLTIIVHTLCTCINLVYYFLIPHKTNIHCSQANKYVEKLKDWNFFKSRFGLWLQVAVWSSMIRDKALKLPGWCHASRHIIYQLNLFIYHTLITTIIHYIIMRFKKLISK